VEQVTGAIDHVVLIESNRLLQVLLDCVKDDPTSRPKAQEVHRRCMDILQADGADPRIVGSMGYKAVRELNKAVDEKVEKQRMESIQATGTSSLPVNASQLTVSANSSHESSSNSSPLKQNVPVINVATLNGEQAVELLIDFGCIDSLHEKVAALKEVVDGECLKNLDDVEILKELEGTNSNIRVMRLKVIVEKVQQAVINGISQETMDRISRKCIERKEKKQSSGNNLFFVY
jgi:uncharacterized protein YerC